MAFKKQLNSDDDRRDDILRAVKSGSISPADAERMAAEQGLPPFEYSPSPKDFDVHSLKIWTLEMTVAWIIWRDAGKVATFNNRFRAKWPFWRLSGTKSRGVRPDGHGPLPPLPTYTLETRLPATLADVQNDNRSVLTRADVAASVPSMHVSFNDALEALRARLIDGDVEAHALEFDTNRSSAVLPHVWRYAGLRMHDGSTCIFIENDLGPAYRNITFRRADVVTIWTPERKFPDTPIPGERPDIATVCNAEEDSGQDQKASKDQHKRSDKVRVGRPPSYDWVAFQREVFEILDLWGGILLTDDPTNNRAKLRNMMGDWMAMRYKEPPSESTLKRQIVVAVEAYEQLAAEKRG